MNVSPPTAAKGAWSWRRQGMGSPRRFMSRRKIAEAMPNRAASEKKGG